MHQIDQDVTRYFNVPVVIFIVFLLLPGCQVESQMQTSKARYDSGRWQIQLFGPVNTKYDVDTYIIDLIDSSEQLIFDLQQQGIVVICYFSAGSSEDWREDADQYTDADKGKVLQDWEGENWLDIRSSTVQLVTKNRLDLAVKKGCDGVDPDNVDGYENDTGFAITREDQIHYNKNLAKQAQQRGLLVGLKNTLGLIPELYEEFDFAVNEQCIEFQECSLLQPFVDSSKPVFSIEYARDKAVVEALIEQKELCEQSKGQGLYTLIMPRLLNDSFRGVCL